MITRYETTAEKSIRIDAIDCLRGLALVAMTLFHFLYDLELLGLAERGFASQPGMVWFARSIATTFLMLVGISLFLASVPNGIAAGPFLRRLAKITGAAILITVGTYFATPDVYIFFGILHHIAVASVLGLLFLRLPWWTNVIVGVLILIANNRVESEAFNQALGWWTGLSTVLPRSSDFVPIVPFFAAVLSGIALAQLFQRYQLWPRLARLKLDDRFFRTLRFIGQNSLIYYLVHQPVLIALISTYLVIVGE